MPNSDDEQLASGDSWQRYVNNLATMYYHSKGEEYQPIPDRTHGDAGLEGYSTSGEAVQSYLDEARTAEERKKALETKVRIDLRKLSTHKDYWAQVFLPQRIKIRRWYLIVKAIDNKSILAYAQKYAKEVREENLPFINSDFNAFVKIAEDHFVEAKKMLDQLNFNNFKLNQIVVTEQMIEQLCQTKPDFVKNTENKLSQVYRTETPDALIKRSRNYLERYIQSENVIRQLERNAPLIWESIENYRASKTKSIEMESDLQTDPPNKVVRETRKEIENHLRDRYRNFKSNIIEDISWGTIAMWIGECPLSFRSGQNGN